MSKKPLNPEFWEATYGKDGIRSSRKTLLKYGLTVDQYSALLESQSYRCKICGATTGRESSIKGDVGRSLYVDHDHRTGRIRGLLCGKCNSVLGFADDNATILLKAIQYLKGNL